MTIEQYYKKIGVKNHDEFLALKEKIWSNAKNDCNEQFKALGIENFEDFIKWYDNNYKGIPIGVFVNPVPEQYKVQSE
ncbi:hypothetical protein PBV87_09075 [Niameybacter massiliensis]|uniref:Uncharacterized protein n=1 Tax=Holtiella tumoricola TaxID=3018743 RepID=A0AA42J0Y1_9FIRM|nr:hypothetical protein [Holtiella tumoricola]MDA3731626.1 hypothetical protein [Holtiella tumoricola]